MHTSHWTSPVDGAYGCQCGSSSQIGVLVTVIAASRSARSDRQRAVCQRAVCQRAVCQRTVCQRTARHLGCIYARDRSREIRYATRNDSRADCQFLHAVYASTRNAINTIAISISVASIILIARKTFSSGDTTSFVTFWVGAAYQLVQHALRVPQ